MFEPQPQFKERLTALVGELGRDVTRFEPAAAWREKGHSAGADSELGAAWHKAHKAKGKGKGKGKGRGGVGVG